MALNLKKLGTRSLSAAVFVVLLMGSVCWNYYSFTVFFFIVALIGLKEFYALTERMEARPYKRVGILSAVIVYFSFTSFNSPALDLKGVIFVIPVMVCSVALFNKREHPVQNMFYTMGGVLYAVAPFALLHEFTIHQPITGLYDPRLVLGAIFLIWSNDTFAYLGGSLFGKHKMIERVSPGKTWEGTAFGILVTFGVSWLISHFMFHGKDQSLWMLLGIIVPVAATTGDLVESMLKRQAGVKDSGNIMPGHGGVLDRFDSLLFVSPVVFVLLRVIL